MLMNILLYPEQYTKEARLQELEAALRLTQPKYKSGQVPFPLSYTEIVLLNNIAISLANCGNKRTAIDILYKIASRKTFMGSIDDITAYECARQSVEKDIANRVSEECLQCSYYRYCENKCPGSNLLATGQESLVSRPLCYAAQCLINQVIYRLAKLGNAPEAYQIFIERLHKAAAAAQVLGG